MNKEQVLEAMESIGQTHFVAPLRAAIVALYEENERLRRRVEMRDDALAAPHTARDDEWKAVAINDPIRAIKICRALRGLGLREAKDVVDAYRSAR